MTAVATVSSEFTLTIPPQFREFIRAGQEVTISADESGRLVITPIEFIRARLEETFGMWADRRDIPADGIAYMDEVRRGHRLEDFGVISNEAD